MCPELSLEPQWDASQWRAPVHSDVWLHGYRLQKELAFVPSHDYLVAFHLLWSPVPYIDKDDLQLLMLLPPPSEC